MYYKVIKNGKIIDVLDTLVFLNYQEKHKRMQFCDEFNAQAILSSDKQTIWHEESLHKIPVAGYDTVRVEEIDEREYRQLKVLNMQTPEEIIDAYMITLFENGVI